MRLIALLSAIFVLGACGSARSRGQWTPAVGHEAESPAEADDDALVSVELNEPTWSSNKDGYETVAIDVPLTRWDSISLQLGFANQRSIPERFALVTFYFATLTPTYELASSVLFRAGDRTVVDAARWGDYHGGPGNNSLGIGLESFTVRIAPALLEQWVEQDDLSLNVGTRRVVLSSEQTERIRRFANAIRRPAAVGRSNRPDVAPQWKTSARSVLR